MDAGLAALIGAHTGSLATLLGNALQFRKEDRRHERKLADARQSRLLNRRLAAHELLYSIVMKKIDYAEGGHTDHDCPQSRKAMWAALDQVQVIASAGVSSAAESAVRAVSFVENYLAEHPADDVRPDDWDQHIATLRPLAQRCLEMLHIEVGAMD